MYDMLLLFDVFFFFFKQKTAYEMRISDWSSDVCSSDLDDLNALVRWTDRRLARVRYRDGWGVVCGLDLCIDPHCPTRVTVSSGYAVDCCGDDLVLCDTGCIDLRDCCPDPCLPAETDQSQAEKIEKRFDQEMAERLGIAHLPFRFRKCEIGTA